MPPAEAPMPTTGKGRKARSAVVVGPRAPPASAPVSPARSSYSSIYNLHSYLGKDTRAGGPPCADNPLPLAYGRMTRRSRPRFAVVHVTFSAAAPLARYGGPPFALDYRSFAVARPGRHRHRYSGEGLPAHRAELEVGAQ